jgi:hypothetical protein
LIFDYRPPLATGALPDLTAEDTERAQTVFHFTARAAFR